MGVLCLFVPRSVNTLVGTALASFPLSALGLYQPVGQQCAVGGVGSSGPHAKRAS